MDSAPRGSRRFSPPSLARWLVLLAAGTMLFALAAGGLHHHAAKEFPHPCAVCSLSHAPATAPEAVAVPGPECTTQSVLPPRAPTLRAACILASPSRAPPSA